MFRVPSKEAGETYRLAIVGLLTLSAAALAVTIWVMVDFLQEQEIVKGLIKKLPPEAKGDAEALAGELRWQFRLTILVVLNLVVTGIAVVLLWRAYRSSQDSLREIKAFASDILSSMNQGVITTDVNGIVTSINRRGLEILAPANESVGEPLQVLSSDIPLDAFRHDWQEEKSVAMTRDFKTGERGSERTVRAFCQTLSNYEGNEIGNVLQLRDVTERVLVDDRLRRMERYMGLGSLAVGLHHEIKNPLAALSLHAQLLEEQIDEGEPSEDVRQMMGIIKTEVNRMGSVLEGFRDFASVERLNSTEVDLPQLLHRQVELITPRADQQNIEILLQVPAEDIPKLPGDHVRLEQVLLNILLNAMQAMPSGGTLTIATRQEDDFVNVSVQDTGCGIPDDLRERVFDPYFTTRSEGTGLGLALCDKIVRQHHGSLEFHSTGAGTVFQMKLPISDG
jgi:two-component system sensor histidine kinase HydH